MATAPQVQTFETPQRTIVVEKPDSNWLERTVSAREEARILFEMMVRSNASVESVWELITIPPLIELALLEYAEKHPEDAFVSIQRVVRFRKQVTAEFERLTASSRGVEG